MWQFVFNSIAVSHFNNISIYGISELFSPRWCLACWRPPRGRGRRGSGNAASLPFGNLKHENKLNNFRWLLYDWLSDVRFQTWIRIDEVRVQFLVAAEESGNIRKSESRCMTCTEIIAEAQNGLQDLQERPRQGQAGTVGTNFTRLGARNFAVVTWRIYHLLFSRPYGNIPALSGRVV